MRADLQAVEAQRYAAERRLAAIRAERLPAVSVFADNGRTGNSIGRLLDTYSRVVQVSIPVFDGLQREARMAGQQAAVRELDVARRDLAQQVLLEVREAQIQLASAGERLTASNQRLTLAEQELALARSRFTEGVAGSAAVITALLGLSAARTQVIDARAGVEFARVALARAQGRVTELP